ncbi:carbon-nitrogen hydrolase family protein [Kutzneria buriramensis]|uniref:Putative amidohydrolase n=1 Tax=Kutzneria buriramensis TaxID=1045776 RepID=A0A3E0H400_9PSEU|nr:carbon-nitrogen hydrolase family protein [Kutzneria buriramensis]REH37279.1 putative amidohydrolase [Kutzneria buriramensis]
MRIALSQFVSDTDPEANLATVGEQTAEAARRGARIVVFPEATMARFGIPLGGLAQPLDGPWASGVRDIAKRHDVLVVAGMFTPSDDGRVRNTLLVTGLGVDEHYDKIHLFDAFGFAESETVAPGDRSVTLEVDGVGIGVATCYDLRFPQLFQKLARSGASVILVPASWGSGPGKRDQWELLVRARALDSTTWIAACGQADPSSVGVTTKPGVPTGIGYSAVVSPMGEIRAQAQDRPELLVVDVDTAEVAEARGKVPVLANARDFS